MRKLLIVASLIYCCCVYPTIYSQQWVATYNGTSNGDDKAFAITVDSLGNIYMAGYVTNTNTGIDMCLIKLNSSGVLQWKKNYDGPAHSDDKAYAITIDKALNVFITGYSTSINGHKDFTTIKYNSSGTQQWLQSYNTPMNKDDEAKSIILDDSGNVYVTGYITLAYADIYVIKYNKNGVFQWGQPYEGPGNEDDKAYAISIDSYRNIYVSGYSMGVQTGYDYILLKFSSNGNLLWSARHNGTENADDKGYGIVVDKSNNIIITGQSLNEITGYDYVTIKYNSNGEIQWERTFNGPEDSDDKAYGIVVDDIGNTYITGTTQRDTSSDSIDILTLKYNINGNEMWVVSYNDTVCNDADIPYGVILHPFKNSVYVCGTSKANPQNNSEDIVITKYHLGSGSLQQRTKYHGSANGDDAAYAITIDKFDNVIIGGYVSNILTGHDFVSAKYQNGDLIGINNISVEIPQYYKLHQNYPNPFNPVTTIKFEIERSNNVTIKIYDVMGREISVLVNEYLKAGTYEAICDFSKYSSGIYLYEINTGDFRDVKKMILIK